jgi:pyruvate/2-oxoglutarate dehydrogenase complex dihydrolipoamide dehydrogenase (E3) component
MHLRLAVAEIIAGVRNSLDKQPVPLVVYSDPEIATVSLSEDEAKQLGILNNGWYLPIQCF